MKLTDQIKNIFSSLLPVGNNLDFNESFENLGIESIDLVTARVQIENGLNVRIPDESWIEFETINEIVNFLSKNEEQNTQETQVENLPQFQQDYVVNMPQMAIEALSENWLFKEIGDKHWEMLCAGLNANSFDLTDSMGNRLYATFVRIRLNMSSSLADFTENQNVKMKGYISRFGESMYFSNINFGDGSTFVNADLMTTFSIRNASDNKRLTKSQPAPGQNTINALNANPSFGDEYRLIKKQVKTSISFENYNFDISEDILFEREYELSPYHDLNGVGLLYFAAYPIINDICEASHFNQKLEERWELNYFTSFKDILYYGNCNIDDSIIYRLHSYENIDDNHIKISSSLYRKSDNAVMAKIFSVKKKRS